jgi:tetratricopeptide (TPR) repeat protein
MTDKTALQIPPELLAAVERSGNGEFTRLIRQCHEILAANPQHAQALHVVGGIAHRLRQLDIAADFIRAAVQLDPENVEFVGNLGNLYQDLGRIDLGIECFRKAIVLAPKMGIAHNNLANLLHEKGELEGAAASYRRAVEMQPDFFPAWSNLGIVLKKLDQIEPAIEAFEEANRIKPDFVAAGVNLCTVYQEQGAVDRAIAGLTDIVGRHPDAIAPANKLMEIHFERGELAQAAGLASGVRKLDPRHQLAIACEAFGRLESGDVDGFVDLYGRQDLIHRQMIPPPGGFSDRAQLHDALEQEILEHPSLKWVHDTYETSRRGFVFGVLDQPGPALAAIGDMLHERVADFIANMPREPDHPLYGMAPENMTLKLWATILTGSGHHPSHLHEGTWLSGTYYVRVPKAANNQDHAGWIAFDGFSHLPGFEQNGEKLVRRVEPEEGLLVLFPSYAFHETVAFEGDDTRIGLSFDFIPA